MRRDTKTTQTQELDAAIFFFSEVLAYEQAHGLKPATTPPTTTTTTELGHDQQVEEINPKDYAERELVQGKAPGQVMLALVELYDDMPQWKAAALVSRLSVVGLDQFEKDKLKGKFQRRTKKFRK